MLASFKLMYPYFTEKEVERFKNFCALNQIPANRATNSPKLDIMWLPFLRRLNKLDAAVSINPPCSGDIGAWRYERFILGYEKIKAAQENEIACIRKDHWSLAKEFLDPLELLSGLSLLQQLEKRHEALEKIRAALSTTAVSDAASAAALPEPEVKPLLFQMPLETKAPHASQFPKFLEPLTVNGDVVEELEKLKL